MPKKIDEELKARTVRLVNDHQGEYSSLTTAAAVVAKQRPAGARRPWAGDRALRPAMRSPGRPEPSRAAALNREPHLL
ncbi:hypothetical protein HJG43_02640 [Kineosporiaceae bacterium SCSIO 59966]|nr:hypothetical protein HJG43_02640 [Kineosporiaceae bacterium SCSIO 59966]